VPLKILDTKRILHNGRIGQKAAAELPHSKALRAEAGHDTLAE
jgi:hypothetical protein